MDAASGENFKLNEAANQESNENESLDRTAFLLARLQELKAWQREQEQILLRDQEEQMEQIACFPLNQFGLENVNANENFAWTDNIRRENASNPKIIHPCVESKKDFNILSSSGAKPFLRRGSGLARYGGISGSPKGVVRRRSKGNSSPMNQMKRSTSTSTVAQTRKDCEENTRRASTADGRMKQSTSCPRISSAVASISKNSPNSPSPQEPNKASRKITSKTNKLPPKSLKLKNVKKQSSVYPGEALSSEKNDQESKKLPQIKSGRIISSTNDELFCSPSETEQNPFQIPQDPKRNTVALSNAKNDQTAAGKINSMPTIGPYDSVELSFMEKLAKANKIHTKELEDLATFEMLEGKLATTDLSSICSSSSAVKTLQESRKFNNEKNEGISPPISPIVSRRKSFVDAGSVTSTPLSNKINNIVTNKSSENNVIRTHEVEARVVNGVNEESIAKADFINENTDLSAPMVNHNLMRDIKEFLASNAVKERESALKENSNGQDTEEDDTLKDDAIDGIPSDEDVLNIDKEPPNKQPNSRPITILNGYNDSYIDDQLSKNSFEDEIIGGDTVNKNKNVRFQEKLEKEKFEALTFSPPRIPKNSPSYLIWSIFTREREEKNRQKAKKLEKRKDEDEEWLDVEDDQENPGRGLSKINSRDIHKRGRDPLQRRRRSESPMSRISSKRNNIFELDQNETAFQDALFNAKLVELNKQVEEFKKENSNMQTSRRRLAADRKQLAKDIDEFERNRESEKKKIEEERKRLRREKAMFEKCQKDKKSNNDRKAQDEIDELQAKVHKINEELSRKEAKWAVALSKLQEQVKFLERENQQLHEDNHKLKLKGVSAKVSSHLINPANRRIYSASNSIGDIDSPIGTTGNSNQLFSNVCPPLYQLPKSNSVDSGMRPESVSSASTPPVNNVSNPNVVNNKAEKVGNSSEPDERQFLAFSPAESLDSNVTLVSAGMSDPISLKSTLNTVSNGQNEARDKMCSKSSQDPITYSINPEKSKLPLTKPNKEVKHVERVEKNEDKVVKYYSDGSIEICCANGHRKEVSKDGKTAKVFYNNGDIKETLPSGLVKYFYSGVKTWRFNYPDGIEITQFNNGKEERKFPDGTIVIIEANGDRIILLPNGQKEEHTSKYKKREYPDGTVKIVYEDGEQETRYSSGRIRKKDVQGNLIFDSDMTYEPVDNVSHHFAGSSSASIAPNKMNSAGQISTRTPATTVMMNSA